MKRTFLFCYLLLAPALFTFGWGFFGHKVANQLAIYALPKEMQRFYFQNQHYLVKNSVRPDERRSTDKQEAPRHFLDADIYGDSGAYQLPQTWAGAIMKYHRDTLHKYGIVPWQVMKMKRLLTHAFQTKNTDSILFYSADMGHYIADAHVPLHATQNYDGQLSNQKGIHSLWESALPEKHIQNYNLYTSNATYLSDPETAIWETVRSSYRLVKPVLDGEKQVSENFTPETKYIVTEKNGKQKKTYSDAFVAAYEKKLAPMVEERLRLSAQMVGNFWYTCWVDGGKPDLDKLSGNSLNRKDKKRLKKEVKAWQKNKLVKEKMLLTK